MQNADFTLRSGAILHLSTAPWEEIVNLWQAVRLITLGETDGAAADAKLMASKDVAAATKQLYPWALYNNVKMYPGLFDEEKIGEQARIDYLEIHGKIIEFQMRPFFLMRSSKSTDTNPQAIENRESQ